MRISGYRPMSGDYVIGWMIGGWRHEIEIDGKSFKDKFVMNPVMKHAWQQYDPTNWNQGMRLFYDDDSAGMYDIVESILLSEEHFGMGSHSFSRARTQYCHGETRGVYPLQGLVKMFKSMQTSSAGLIMARGSKWGDLINMSDWITPNDFSPPTKLLKDCLPDIIKRLQKDK